MRCHKAQLLINKLLDGELQEADYRQLKAHLADCSKCCQIYEDWKAIKSGARASAAGKDGPEPSGLVWEKLKDSLEAEIIPRLKGEMDVERGREPRGKAFHWPQLAASPSWKYGAALVIVLAMVAGAFFLGRNHQPPAGQKIQLADQQQALKKIEEAAVYYRQAIESLTEAMKLAAADKSFPPEMAEILQANLQLLDRTIDLCQQAVNQEPGNLRAQDYLLSAYNSKLDFLNNMLETSRSFNSQAGNKL